MLIFFNRSFSLTIIVMTLFLSACNDKNSMPPSTGNLGSTPSILTLTVDPKFGNILTDAAGRTLYMFANDPNGSSHCETGDCALTWPAYYAGDIKPSAGAGVDTSLVGTITHADGSKQTTYRKWPLYRYSGDKNKGEVTGDNFGGIWFVAKPDYSIMLGSQQLIGADNKNYIDALVEGTGITTYLTDGAGVTLYGFSPDKFNLNTFTKPDLSNDQFWPINQSDLISIPSIFTRNMFTTITVAGKKQLTWNGHPMYYYIGDTARGQTKGISIPQPAPWPVLKVSTPPLSPGN
jgi:predicted lipoprotein with Yx(FWY)xxD motif